LYNSYFRTTCDIFVAELHNSKWKFLKSATQAVRRFQSLHNFEF
jgi:hypothetical protein